MYTLIANIAGAISALVSGYALTVIGFVAGREQPQGLDVTWRLSALTILAGPFISLIALAFIMKYPVTKSVLDKIRNENQESL